MTLPDTLRGALIKPSSLTIALSGGIDSLTLSAAAAHARGVDGVTLCHAISPAVPAAATARVRDFAATHGLALRIVDAGEFQDEAYRANPVNRCYFCKSHLYGRLAQLGRTVAAGTNLDDLSDYRPGLVAADEHGVLHPFVAAGMDKKAVRGLARQLGLGDLADLPAAPCLASRIETGLRVDPEDMRVIDAVEEDLRGLLGGVTLRCRHLRTGWVVELAEDVLDGLTSVRRAQVIAAVADRLPGGIAVTLRPYKKGSAFVHE